MLNRPASGFSPTRAATDTAFGALAAAPAAAAGAAEPERLARGQALAGKLHCVGCHGADFAGGKQVPRLAGQREDYLRTALAGFRAGRRVGYTPANHNGSRFVDLTVLGRDGTYVAIDGNRLGVLMLDHVLDKMTGRLPRNGWVLTTLVTTPLLGTIARAHGIEVVDDLRKERPDVVPYVIPRMILTQNYDMPGWKEEALAHVVRPDWGIEIDGVRTLPFAGVSKRSSSSPASVPVSTASTSCTTNSSISVKSPARAMFTSVSWPVETTTSADTCRT